MLRFGSDDAPASRGWLGLVVAARKNADTCADYHDGALPSGGPTSRPSRGAAPIWVWFETWPQFVHSQPSAEAPPRSGDSA